MNFENEQIEKFEKETRKHIDTVRHNIFEIVKELAVRQMEHDKSKLNPPEREIFIEYTPKLAASTYGSEEYKTMTKEMKPALDHHYANNRHHPEYYKNWKCPLCHSVFDESQTEPCELYDGKPRFCPKCTGGHAIFEAVLEPHLCINGMTLVDVIEMFCDWEAATHRHNDGCIYKSIEIQQKKLGFSDDIKQIFINTANIFKK